MNDQGRTVTLNFDTAVHTLEAIKNASYDFTERADISIELVTPGKIRVSLSPIKNLGSPIDSMSSDFIRHALDHQIRLDVGKDYKLIREMIVAQAFEPVDNLEEVVGTLKP